MEPPLDPTLNDYDSKGFTKLINAILDENVDEVQYLLEHGADPNLKNKTPKDNKTSNTPLFYALTPKLSGKITGRNIEIVNLLLKYGADVNTITYGPLGFISLAADPITYEDIYNSTNNPVIYYAIEKDNPAIFDLLLDAGADISGDKGLRMFGFAVYQDNFYILDRLLDAGIDLSQWSLERTGSKERKYSGGILGLIIHQNIEMTLIKKFIRNGAIEWNNRGIIRLLNELDKSVMDNDLEFDNLKTYPEKLRLLLSIGADPTIDYYEQYGYKEDSPTWKHDLFKENYQMNILALFDDIVKDNDYLQRRDILPILKRFRQLLEEFIYLKKRANLIEINNQVNPQLLFGSSLRDFSEYGINNFTIIVYRGYRVLLREKLESLKIFREKGLSKVTIQSWLNIQDKTGSSALHYAATQAKDPLIVDLLVDAGADSSLRNLKGYNLWGYLKIIPELSELAKEYSVKLSRQLQEETERDRTFYGQIPRDIAGLTEKFLRGKSQ